MKKQASIHNSFIIKVFLFICLLGIVFSSKKTMAYETAWFPAPQVYLTQLAYETYSHGNCNAIDIAPGGNVFAPFTGVVKQKAANWGYVLLQSTDKVYFADGSLDYMTVGFMHDSNISNISVGQTISQGTDFYQAGGMGNGNPNAYGAHVDISVFKGKVDSVTSFGRGNYYAYNSFVVNTNRTRIVYPGKVESGNSVNNGAPSDYTGLWRTSVAPTTAQLDVNGWLDGNNSGNVSGYATFDMYINGSKVSDDVSDFYQPVNIGSSYEIKDIKVMTGKALEGYSSVASGGYVSGGRTGTVNSNTDVRLQLHTVDAAGFVNGHSPSIVSTYNGHSYYFYDAPVTWYDAKIISEYLGGHLVTITSAEENNFVKEMIGNANCWIGATDSAAEGAWKWVNNEAFSYSNWGASEPNNTPGTIEGEEDFAHFSAGGNYWNDNEGADLFPFICEIDRAYTVVYNINGGEGKIASQEKAVGQTITLSTSVPVRNGYSFIGWAADPDAAESEYASGGAYGEDEDITLYAVWEKDCDHQVIYAVETAPTFGSEGKLSGTCSICGRKVEKVLPVLNETDYQCEVKEPSMCMEDGIMSYVWNTEEGQTFSFETAIPALGHDYVATENPPTCSDYGSITHTCSRCGDSYTEYLPKPDDSDAWTTEKPVGVPDEQIETKTQYRYSDYDTMTSYNTFEAGYSQKSSTWERSGSGSVQYVQSWPSGFNTGHGLYGTYNKSPRSASETATEKTTIDSNSVCGYIYYHWCRGTYADGPINRATRTYQTGEFNAFHAFYSTTNPSSLTASSDGDGSRIHSNASVCRDSYWYYNIPVYNQTYTTYRKLFTYERWTDWSEWSDTEYTSSSTRRVETRTVYKYEADIDSRHRWGAPVYTWDEGTDTLTAEYTCELDSSHKKTETLENLDVLRLPAGLQIIEEEAFEGTASQVIIIPEGCTTIGARAFADCPELLYVVLPGSVTTVAENAFEGSTKLSN